MGTYSSWTVKGGTVNLEAVLLYHNFALRNVIARRIGAKIGGQAYLVQAGS